MQKTTVYLPDNLKAALERAATESQRTESAIIREGIEIVLARQQPPTPRSGIFDSGEPALSERVDELLNDFGRS